MPLRQYKLDPGFTDIPVANAPEAKQGETPFVTVGGVLDTLSIVAAPVNPSGAVAAYQRNFETLNAAFRLENDVIAAVDLMTRPTFEPDPSFDIVTKLKETGLWDQYRDNFLSVESEAEFNSVAQRIAQENADRASLQRAGLGGLLAAVAAGMVSPTVLLPFVGGARGFKAVAQGAAMGLAGGAAQEIPLQLAQETRTLGESVTSVAMSTVLGGVLGGAIGMVNRRLDDVAIEVETGFTMPPVPDGHIRYYSGGGTEWATPDFDYARAYADGIGNGHVYFVDIPESVVKSSTDLYDEVNDFIRHGRIEKEWSDKYTQIPNEADMANAPGSTAIPRYASIGAAAPSLHAGGLKAGVGNALSFNSPVTRVLSSSLKQAQYMMAQLSDAGVRLEGNEQGIATSVGGTVENRVKTYYAPVAEGVTLLDDAFSRYWFGTARPGFAAAQRASLAALSPFATRMSKSAFKAEVADAMRNGDSHPIAEVQEVAQWYRKNLFDPIYERAQKAGIYREVEELDEAEVLGALGDKSYLNRDYNKTAIQARETDFIQILANHFEGKLQTDFQKRLERFLERQSKLGIQAEDLARSEEEVAKLQEEFKKELGLLDEARTPEEVSLDERISELRSISRNKRYTPQEQKDARDMARALEDSAPASRTERGVRKRELQRRLRNLNRSMVMMGKRQAAKLERIDRAEELSLASLMRVVKKGQKLLNKLDNLSDEELAKEISNIKNMFADTAEKFDRGEMRIEKIFQDEFDADKPTEPFVAAARTQTERFDRLTELAERLDEVEGDRVAAREVITEALEESLVKVNNLNGRRAVRAERLKTQAAALDPAHVQTKLAEIAEEMKVRKDTFLEETRLRGADDVDIAGGKALFSRYAKQLASDTTHKILGTHMRLPGFDIILEPRGAELARVLDIPSEQIKDFLENDIEKLAMQYVRTLGPDIELMNKLGEFAPDMGRNLEFKKLQEEYDARVAAQTEEMRAAGRSEEAIEKANLKLAEEYKAVRRDLEAVIGRLRHTWGIPKDPAGFAARAARIATNLNVLRFMGSVTISSIPDIARPIQKYGLMRTFRDGWLPFIRGVAAGKFTNRELRLAGAALDVVLHSRAHQIYDIGDYMVRGSKFEKALEWGTSKVGLINVFDIWTTAMKQVAGSVSIAKVLDSIDMVTNLNGGMRETAQAMEYLASVGINNELAGHIWKQVLKAGGGEKVNGTWWPNTEAWDNLNGEVDAFRAALVKEVDDTIITPGVERPLWMDSSLTGRVLGQFKSFGMSSTTKTFMAGLQQRDMAFISGTMISLALGGLSYYIWANTVGGDALTEMEAALADLDGEGWKRFADEAISRSGNLAIMQEVQDFLAGIPLTAPYVTFSGERSTRRGHKADWLEVATGPTGDFVRTAGDVATGLHEPTRSTLHKFRTLMPLQNNFYLRQGFDAIEQAFGLPESRQ